MRAEIFYQTELKNTVPMLLVSSTEWDEGNLTLTEEQTTLLKAQQFKGKIGDICLETDETGSLSRVYIGTGEGNGNDISAVNEANEARALATAVLKLPQAAYSREEGLSEFAMLQWALAQYKFDKYKKNETSAKTLFVPAEKLKALTTEANAIFLVRDLINTPANAMGPEDLSHAMRALAEEWDAQFQEWVGEDLLAANFPAIYTVGRASANPPRLLRFTWGDPRHPRIALIGKGVCFDSGGLNIKNADSMRLMKKDMGGAAQVLGLAAIIMGKRLPLYLDVIIPAVDNLIGPSAYRPGDIITMRNGLTVEIDNTDAEGRLVLADAIALACESNPELLIDFATLTGAARVSVGTEIAAMFTNQDDLSLSLMRASKETQDPLWPLPLFSAYETMLSSSVADMVNCTPSSYAGAITAALFLQRYLKPDVPWVHFDVMAWNLSTKPGKPEGGEAMGIRAVAHYLKQKYAEKP
jgi:leucyl aminopeptidase